MSFEGILHVSKVGSFSAVCTTVSFKYDPFGRRIYKSSSGGTSIYAYDDDNLVEETNSSGAAVARYSQTQNVDEPLAMLRSSATSYYEVDGLGSVTLTTAVWFCYRSGFHKPTRVGKNGRSSGGRSPRPDLSRCEFRL